MQSVRHQWESITQSTRRVAVAADAGLRRRHPRLPIPPLHPHSAEATPGQQRQVADRLADLGLTLATAADPIPPEVVQGRQAAAAKQPEIDELRSLRLPGDEHAEASPGLACPERERRQRAAVQRAAEPEMAASERIMTEYQRSGRDGGRWSKVTGMVAVLVAGRS